MLVPFCMLLGQIDLVKTINFENVQEKHWIDEHGNKSIVIENANNKFHKKGGRELKWS